jgi:hypothetical protein
VSDTRTKRERFLPYAYEKAGVRFAIEAIVLDGSERIDEFDTEGHIVELRGTWRQAEVGVAIDVAPEVLQRVLPSHELADPPVALAIVLRCEATRVRRGTMVPLDAARSTIAIAKDDLFGVAELVPFLVRTRAAERPQAGFAEAAGARLAGGRPWLLRTDLERLPSGQHLDVQFKPFSEDVAIPAHERGALWRLDAAQDAPVLWLNSDHDEIAALLAQEGTRGRRSSLRDILFDRISISVWTQLFLRAALDVTSVDEAPYGWEEGVLDALLPQLYPHASTREGRLDRLRQEIDDIPDLLARLDAVLQVRDEAIAHITRMVEDL